MFFLRCRQQGHKVWKGDRSITVDFHSIVGNKFSSAVGIVLFQGEKYFMSLTNYMQRLLMIGCGVKA